MTTVWQSVNPTVQPEELGTAIKQAQEWLLQRQHADGFWAGELEADTSLESDTIKLMHFLGRVDASRQAKMANYILSQQQSDGTWAIYAGGDGDITLTVKAYVALRLAGYAGDHPALVRARAAILRLGGVERVNTFEKFYLAVFGLYPWSGVLAIPPEVMFLPRWFPINIYEVSAWSRTILVPMAIVWALRPTVTLSADFSIDELYVNRAGAARMSLNPHSKSVRWQQFFLTVDRVLKRLERLPVKLLRRAALRRAERWMVARLRRSDGLGAIYPAMVNAVMALWALGHCDGDPVLEQAVEELRKLEIEEIDTVRLQPCFSPIWDTGLSIIALRDSGLPADHPALVKAARWLLDKEIREVGDWAVKTRGVAPSGWAFEFNNEFYPDVDDAAMVLLAMSRVQMDPAGERRKAETMRRALDWIFAMQNRTGGWSSFDKDNDLKALEHLPYADHNAMLDPSVADITGRMLEMFGALGVDPQRQAVRRAVSFLLREQEPDGSWFGRWGVNYIYGTWQALRGLRAIGADLTKPTVRLAVHWLSGVQNEDGGWGESCRSYEDPKWKGCGPSTASQTAWAVMGLLAGGVKLTAGVRRGVVYLLKTQRPDGTWSEPWYTGTGFPRVFYLNYHLYRHYFPLWCLGQVQRKVQPWRSSVESAETIASVAEG